MGDSRKPTGAQEAHIREQQGKPRTEQTPMMGLREREKEGVGNRTDMRKA